SNKCSLYPRLLINQRPTSEKSPIFEPETKNPIIVIIIIRINGEYGISPIDNTHLKASTPSYITSRILSKSGCLLSLVKSRNCSTHSSNGILGNILLSSIYDVPPISINNFIISLESTHNCTADYNTLKFIFFVYYRKRCSSF